MKCPLNPGDLGRNGCDSDSALKRATQEVASEQEQCVINHDKREHSKDSKDLHRDCADRPLDVRNRISNMRSSFCIARDITDLVMLGRLPANGEAALLFQRISSRASEANDRFQITVRRGSYGE